MQGMKMNALANRVFVVGFGPPALDKRLIESQASTQQSIRCAKNAGSCPTNKRGSFYQLIICFSLSLSSSVVAFNSLSILVFVFVGPD